MQKLLLSLLIVSATLVAGCTTSARVQSEYKLPQGEKFSFQVTAPTNVSAEARQIFDERLRGQLAGGSLLAGSSDVNARSLEIAVTTYNMRHGAARALLGILAGSDDMQSTVKVRDRGTGAVLSEFSVESRNSTAWGTSKGMIEDQADKIVETLKGGKK
ncbi:MAG: DUF4410 domain-containing protein [Ramlibacter sp.]